MPTAATNQQTAAEPSAQRGTADLRVREFQPLPTPTELINEQPLGHRSASVIERGRNQVQAIMDGVDDRLLLIVGPCSIHDPLAGLVYARRLAELADLVREDAMIVMRTYFEKPRTTVGWKGLINDPHLDGSHDIAGGLRAARSLLLAVADLGLPSATEFLEPISPQYVADLISWGAIGARTAESQVHRQLVSGLSMPIGFKNATDGDVQVAIDGCAAAAAAQSFLGIDGLGRASLVRTNGNPDTHLVLRGGASGPNYGPGPVARASERMRRAGENPRLIIDASHGNSGKDHVREEQVAAEIAEQVAAVGPGASGGQAVAGVMLESFLVGGAQKLDVSVGSEQLTFGQSVTDACMSWEVTAEVVAALAAAARRRRSGGA
ncbi:MAG: 3-deoxy-7-phosphoheptulonate synthase [Propionibacteriaceae bacterium]